MYHSAVFALEGVISPAKKMELGMAGVVVCEVKSMDDIKICCGRTTEPGLSKPQFYPRSDYQGLSGIYDPGLR